MIHSHTICAITTLASLCAATPPDDGPLGLMPMPATLEFGRESMPLGTQVSIAIEGHTSPRIERAIERFVAHISSSIRRSLQHVMTESPDIAQLLIRCKGPGERVQTPDEDESYTLQVSPDQIQLDALTTVGVLRGLATLEQLLRRTDSGYEFPTVRIEDEPRFGWRGLLIDVCRHWQPMPVILRNLDAMAAVKLNVLHLHLTEDQGFRVESMRFPKLHEQGSDGQYFTQVELREIVAYARDRGIRIVPEFDMPGHTTSWLVGHPELAASPGPFEIERRWGVFDPCFDPTKESLYAFLDSFFAEMITIFPDPYVHIGGDEVNGKLWAVHQDIQSIMQEKSLPDSHALQAYFNRRVAAILRKYGRTMIGWDEILRDDLPKKCVVQSWRGVESLHQSVTRGFDALLSHGYYLDHQRPASFHYLNDPDPTDTMTHAGGGARILGGEACMWGEYVTPATIDSRIWPRLAAIAERLWSPIHVRNVDEMYRRLEAVSVQLDRIGALHVANYQPMLLRLTEGQSTNALRVLADVVEPVKFYQRSASRNYTSRTPLNRLVDAARPESRTAREFSALVERFLSRPTKNSRERAGIRVYLILWQANHATLSPIISTSPMLDEIRPLSKNLRDLATIGLESLDRIALGRIASDVWTKQAVEILESAAVPVAEVKLAVLPGISTLVKTAGTRR